jgi:recombination protein RecT
MSQQKNAAAVALDKPAQSVGQLRQLFARPDVIEQVKLTLPKHMSPERITKILLSTVIKTPSLMQCSQLTLMQALTQLSELGLEPGSAFGHVYLIPFGSTVQIIIGYKGLLELARRSGFVAQIESHVVFEDEVFELEYGLAGTRKFRHVPNIRDPRDEKKAIAVYCIARLKDGSEHVEVMPMDEVRAIRNKSQGYQRSKKSGKPGPWDEHFLQMARKTAIRRACNYLPLSAEMASALELEDSAEGGSTVTKPSLHVAGADDLASQIANAQAASQPTETVDGEVVDQATGEVSAAPAEEAPAAQPPANAEPEKGTVDHLLWRIGQADAAQLADLIKEAAGLPKDEPRRMEVGAAISERRKAVRS